MPVTGEGVQNSWKSTAVQQVVVEEEVHEGLPGVGLVGMAAVNEPEQVQAAAEVVMVGGVEVEHADLVR